MLDMDVIASRMYGGSTPAAETGAPAPAPGPEAKQADPTKHFENLGAKLYAKPAPVVVDVPESVQKLREGGRIDDDPMASRLYQPQPHSDVLAALKQIDPDEAVATAHAREWAAVAADCNANAADVSIATAAIRKYSANPLSDADEAALSAKASKALDQAHGSEAPRVRSAIKALLERDARLSTQIIDSGAIFDPQVFLALGDLARRELMRGRIKVK